MGLGSLSEERRRSCLALAGVGARQIREGQREVGGRRDEASGLADVVGEEHAATEELAALRTLEGVLPSLTQTRSYFDQKVDREVARLLEGAAAVQEGTREASPVAFSVREFELAHPPVRELASSLQSVALTHLEGEVSATAVEEGLLLPLRYVGEWLIRLC